MDTESDATLIAASLDDPEHFGALFDRHATVLFRYLVRRVGVDEADTLLGEVFRVAFEKRATYDCERANARPWLYGIASNLLARYRRTEARRIHATARLLARHRPAADPADEIADDLDAQHLWPHVADAVAALPEEERDALLLYVWEELSYDEIASALDVPVGTVRSRLNRARQRLRELRASIGRTVSDDFDALRKLRPDRVHPDDPVEPTVFAREKERLMASIGATEPTTSSDLRMPDIYPRLAYDDERAALDYLVRVFQLTEIREARNEMDDGMLAWLRVGDGVVMIGRANAEVHRIHSPHTLGNTTVQMMVYVQDVDAHYAHAVSEGADVTMTIEDAFYGERRYEATDLEGHRWHFGERFGDIKTRGGTVPEDA